MSLKTLQQMPSAETIKESPHTLDFIRRRISGIFQNDILDDNGQLAILELILCLANEISDLKQEVRYQANNETKYLSDNK